MEVLLGVLIGVGTVVTLARRGNATRSAVAWTARQAGALSGKVTKSLDEAARLAREEYERGRVEQLGRPLGEGLDVEKGNHAREHRPTHLNGV